MDFFFSMIDVILIFANLFLALQLCGLPMIPDWFLPCITRGSLWDKSIFGITDESYASGVAALGDDYC
jgi:hypothetical protein